MTELDNIKMQILDKALLSQGGIVKIVVLTRITGVRLPNHLMKTETVTLNLSRRFPGGAPVLDPDAIRVRLGFRGTLFDVVVPWSALVFVRDTRNNDFVFPVVGDPEDPDGTAGFPETVLDRTSEFELESIPGGDLLTPPKRGHLKLVN